MTDLQTFQSLVRANLPTNRAPTEDELRESFKKAQMAAQIVYNLDLADDLMTGVWTTMVETSRVQFHLGDVLKDTTVVPWLADARATITPYYWSRYSQSLLDDGWGPQVINVLDQEADRVLNLCGDPREVSPWSRCGLVMGSVQSGKTANYVGLITKAADAGYRTIVVIAGLQNSLRNQTQERIDQGFVGYDSTKPRGQEPVGVGCRDPRRRPFTFTTRLRDFNRSVAGQLGGRLDDLGEPAVFVIKKNSGVLKSLLLWLSANGVLPGKDKIESPLLLIDDEADNASINTQYSRNEVTKINDQIRRLLKLFTHSSYVGYTATPFANIFIDPDTSDDMRGDDLFPRSFIVSLDAPSDYFGPEEIFFEHPTHYVRVIDDNDLALPVDHKIDTPIHALPESLREAIRCYLVALAVRSLRGQGDKHSSMLVNVTRFVQLQKTVWSLVSDYVRVLTEACLAWGRLPANQALADRNVAALHETWTREYRDAWPEWGEVQATLAATAPEVDVVVINGSSNDRLNYAEYLHGRKVIAVGGLALSRGLTLEGLIVSYYLRNSIMYDALMQMGRWFGYRPGYQDLCRVFMTEQSADHYEHVADSIAELRDELKQMQQVGATPVDFGLRVRKHPDTLMITALNKMGRSEDWEWDVNLGNRLIETSRLDRPDASVTANRLVARQLAENLLTNCVLAQPPGTGNYLFEEVSADPVVDFLNRFRNPNDQWPLTNPTTVLNYITPRLNDELARWDVMFAGVTSTVSAAIEDIGPMRIVCQTRKMDGRRSSPEVLFSRKDRIAGRGAERFGLTEDQVRLAERHFQEDEDNAGRSIPDRMYRDVRSRPLLIIHFIAFTADTDPSIPPQSPPPEPVVAWSLSFPSTRQTARSVTYRLNAAAASEYRRLMELDINDDDNSEMGDEE